MTFLMFVLGIIIIAGIARYNQSNKLFWTLFIAFVLGFAGKKLVNDTFFSEKEQSGTSLNQAYPTQGLAVSLDSNMCLFTNENCSATDVETQNLVSQEYTPDFVEHTPTLSNVPGVTQWINLHILPNPPNDIIPHDTS